MISYRYTATEQGAGNSLFSSGIISVFLARGSYKMKWKLQSYKFGMLHSEQDIFAAKNCLTHWGRDKIAAISQTTLSNAYSWMKMLEFWLRFHWSLLLGFQLILSQHWFRKWLGVGQATSYYLNQWWLVNWRIYASLGLNELTNLSPHAT